MTGQVTGQIVPSPGKRKRFPDPSIPLCKWVGYHARRLKSLDMHALKVKIKLFFPAQETERRSFASFRNGVFDDFSIFGRFSMILVDLIQILIRFRRVLQVSLGFLPSKFDDF